MSDQGGRFDVQSLDEKHDRAAFDCGVESLTSYLQKSASQDLKRRVAVPYVLVELSDETRIVGYYTLANASIPLSDVPEDIAKKLPKYPHVPVTLIGRLAVDKADHGKRHGERLLLDALNRALDASRRVASVAVIVDAIDESAAQFYERYGFKRFKDSQRLFIPLKDVEAALSS